MPASRPTAGARRRPFTLERPLDTPDGFGGAIRTYQPGPLLWGALDLVAADERRRHDRTEAAASHRVTLRYRTDLAAGMRLASGLRRFRIRAVTDPDGRRRDLVCLVEEIAA